MARIDEIAEAALAGEALKLRSLIQDFLREERLISDCGAPVSNDPIHCAVAAGIVEILAERRGEAPPPWAHEVQAAPHPVYLVKSAETMQRLRRLCETESPAPLRRRNLLAPPTFLQFA